MKKAILILCMLGSLCICGCLSWGYTSYRPNQAQDYDQYFEPLTGKSWYWVRGKVKGDLDGDGTKEDVVLATVQDGTSHAPGKMKKMCLLVCWRNERDEILPNPLRLDVYDSQSPDKENKPSSMPELKMTKCSADIFSISEKGESIIAVSAWGKLSDGRFACRNMAYMVQKRKLKEVFSSFAIQDNPGLEMKDFNRDGINELVVRQQPLSRSKAPLSSDLFAPEWLDIYAWEKPGRFVAKPGVYTNAYEDLMLAWYQNYSLAINNSVPATELAEFEFYIGRIHLYLNQNDVGRHFLTRALTNSTNKLMRKEAEAALKKLSSKKAESNSDAKSEEKKKVAGSSK